VTNNTSKEVVRREEYAKLFRLIQQAKSTRIASNPRCELIHSAYSFTPHML